MLVAVSIAVFSMGNKETDCHSQFFEASNLSSLSNDSIVRWSLDASERRNHIYIFPSRTGSEIEILFVIKCGREFF